MRTATAAPAGQRQPRIDRCAPTIADTASRALGKAAKTASPAVSTSRPPRSCTAVRMKRRQSLSTAA
jgi:hypothetical protein